MLDKAKLGMEDKSARRGDLPGPATVRCTKCGHKAHWMARTIPGSCPECGAPVVDVNAKPEAK